MKAALAAVVVVTLGHAGAGGGTVLALLPNGSGGFSSARVVSSTGHELGRVKLPAGTSRVSATGTAGRFVAVTQGGAAYLVDASARRATRLAATGVAGVDPRIPATARYAVLDDQSGLPSYVVDTKSGKTTSLGRDVGAASLSPNGSTLLLVGRSTWLVPAAAPSHRIALPKTWFGGSFSADGRRVAFVDPSGGRHRVAVENVDGSGRREFEVALPVLGEAQFLRDGRLLLGGSGEVAVYQLGGKPARVGRITGLPLEVAVAPDGRGAAVGVAVGGSGQPNRWTWLDLRGRQRTLAPLDGETLVSNVVGRYAYFASNLQTRQDVKISVLDLETGAVHAAVSLPHGEMFVSMSIAPGSGAALVDTSTRSSLDVWLVTAIGRSGRLAHSRGIASATFSPDGRWIALSTVVPPAKGQVELLPVAGGAARKAGPGVGAAWAP